MDTDPPSALAPGLAPAAPATCTPFLWNPADGSTTTTPQPTLNDGTTNANLFCSGHAFLPDGRLLVAGGHLNDSHGLNQATIYDPATQGPQAADPAEARAYDTLISSAEGANVRLDIDLLRQRMVSSKNVSITL